MAPLPPQRSGQAELPGTTTQSSGLGMFQNGRTVTANGAQSVSVMSHSKARQLFDRYDNDGSGSISISEFKNLCYDMGYFLTDQELALDVKLLDMDGNGTLGYDEFIKWWRKDDRFKSLQLSEGDIDQLNRYLTHFKRFDKDGSGIIDIREFKSLYVDLVKKKMAKKSLMATLQELDVNKDGKVSFNEYVNWAIANCGTASARPSQTPSDGKLALSPTSTIISKDNQAAI
ncbi:EF-hand [Rhizoclosmatium globosum]|uniref:EF-hand n=1 Tax=Rhizoclosmatium globosum TaxID=329046 RepID=A0A1Y2C0H5_9FUNG|nr:EF-hand [Rhizoclosmatium globosum]|eukprot:ORY39815.1 EF-hand [Rhizoclosmatium globosum]